ncbi:chromosomal replication initiator protein DnaA [Corallococcus sp. H22C18031201]|uniref:chromosomal replication initiator protein DnaA n=1 Tax=Citreicoccus inhibens TaxID=2849499 RepID=UPI000E7439A1|nr:chromosomal replication initiator protein DnaA [Citreicoccus inhibens]MBU8897217.1 chromosomal replication initiator protein DnaA [Citreicoccus inhibens]RJS21215.1 chromosomal replication initiator protein DnaA [Corallococcus sp. H22C18031201]
MNALAQAAPSLPSAGILWARILEAIRQEGRGYALTWLERMRPLDLREGSLVLGVPDRFFRDWVDDHYRALLESHLARLGEGLSKLAYEVVEGPPASANLPPTPTVKANPARPPRLNGRFTFSTYVVADSNQLPAAAAAAVAEKPGHHYNPLYIYGGTGLGKTHLLQAVGNHIWEKDPTQRVVYLSSEQFTNEYVESVREHRMTDFRRKFREECDVLLIDDIQFLGKREETQKEFFYTFNTLYELNKAIVLTSDTVPAEIPGLEERLRSRFTMGLMTDIREPTYETRVAILQKKAEAEGLDLPDAVAHFIAKHIQKNVRELEGALVKLSAMHSLTRQPVTEDFAAQVLKDILPAQRVVDVEAIQREVARFYKVTIEALKEDRRHKQLAHARQVAMYLSRKLTKSSFPEIGARFGKDHSTVISAVRKVEGLRESDPTVHRELVELEARLSG